ncbi:hypothetical protein [Rhodococcus sp. P1Y]|uniref:thiolase family protein n=1 Tax=Rhodococcus sp. P1Y TaxID=1302308 RepID=UPI000EB4144B|nr:hypothetical protein D8W71_02155 [Rhodococcus sp. P1Y]
MHPSLLRKRVLLAPFWGSCALDRATMRAVGPIPAQFTASSQLATHLGAASIVAGDASIVIAGGVESLSRVPMGVSTTAGEEGPFSTNLKALWDMPHQGEAAERAADKYGIKLDACNEFGVRSHHAVHPAWERGAFDNEIVHVRVDDTVLLERDEGIRPDSSVERSLICQTRALCRRVRWRARRPGLGAIRAKPFGDGRRGRYRLDRFTARVVLVNFIGARQLEVVTSTTQWKRQTTRPAASLEVARQRRRSLNRVRPFRSPDSRTCYRWAACSIQMSSRLQLTFVAFGNLVVATRRESSALLTGARLGSAPGAKRRATGHLVRDDPPMYNTVHTHALGLDRLKLGVTSRYDRAWTHPDCDTRKLLRIDKSRVQRGSGKSTSRGLKSAQCRFDSDWGTRVQMDPQ